MEVPAPATPIKRRLTAILAADAVGYSRQMGADEEGTLRVLAAQRLIIDRIIAAHDGRIVGTAGDSVLAEFASSVEAVRCAVEMQEALQTRNETLPESERLVFRVGVNLGDVMVDGANILGDGVNVAARLEGIAEPGGVCISSSVYDQIAGKLSLGFLDIGEQSLKNIARPIRVYRLDRSGAIPGAKRTGLSSRGRLLVLAGIAVVAIAIVGAWQTGMFQRAPAAPPAAPIAILPAPPPVPTAAPPSEDTKLKLQIAEAERAKAEAELARARAEAETARLRNVPSRAPNPAAPPSAAPAPAPAPAAPTAAAAAPATAAPAPATTAPAATAPAPAPPAAAPVAQPAPAVAAAAATIAPADAISAMRRCGPFEELRPFTDELAARVADGEIVVERGTPGQPGFLSVRGRPTPDGQLVLAGTLISVAARTKGNVTGARFVGKYADGQYTLSGQQGKRLCDIVVRAPAPR